ncbi:hypothetical protein [Ruania alba]|uniref:hypothetical protein n=1 Tax=Ruania alba TaxID=648782 RepID=UPI001FE15A14|nr:hypothetical protein [Ruania alba]
MTEDSREQWRQMLEQMLGSEGADEAMRALEASGIDPSQMSGAGFPATPEQMQAAMAQMQQMLAGATTATRTGRWHTMSRGRSRTPAAIRA